MVDLNHIFHLLQNSKYTGVKLKKDREEFENKEYFLNTRADSLSTEKTRCNLITEYLLGLFKEYVTIKVICIVSVVLNILLMVLLVGLKRSSATGPKCDDEDISDVTRSKGVCLSCGLVPLGNQWQRVCDSLDLCCAKDQEPLMRLVQMLSLSSNEEYAQARKPETGSISIRPSAHVYINTTGLLRNGAINWTTKRGVGAFLSRMNLTYNKLNVLEPGNYFVYSFLTFKSKGSGIKELLSHSIYKDNEQLPNTGKQLLVMDKLERPVGHETFKSSYLSAVLRFRSNDRIFTEVSNATALYASAFSNFMGLFKL